MPYPEDTKLTAEQILSRINIEISRRLRGEGESDEAIGDSALGIARINITPAPLAISEEYGFGEFLRFHDADFVHNVFLCLLGRHPGTARHLAALRAGQMSRIEVLGRVRYSPEGRKVAVHVRGLLPRFVLQMSFKVPVLGYLLELVYYLVRLPILAREQRVLGEHVSIRDIELAAQVNERLDEIEKAIKSTTRQ